MSFSDFNFGTPPRTLPRHSAKSSPKRRGIPDDVRLSVIDEDGDAVPSANRIPQNKVLNRPFSRRFHFGDPPRHSFDSSPPKYSVWDVTGPKGEKLQDVRNNKYVARRGGWARLLIIGFVLFAVIVALVVGLVIGLRKKQKNSSTQSPSSSPLGSPNTTFPLGSYAVQTYLDSMPSDCVSNPVTWNCYPYSTYNSSHEASHTTFDWVITQSPAVSFYYISSTKNPFANNFSNVSLTLVDQNLPTERYTFQTTLDHTVVPRADISGDNSATSCLFTGTLFGASLYTKKSKTTPDPVGSSSTISSATPSSTNGAKAWPYAVSVMQTIGGGSNVPTCFKTADGHMGDQITNGITGEPSSKQCKCEWRDFDL